MLLDTRVPGDPAALSGAAAHLREQIAGGADRLADQVLAQRSTLELGWEGAAGAAFHRRATVLGRAGEETAEIIRGSATALDRLASVLTATQTGMRELRRVAAENELVLVGDSICEPMLGGDPATYDQRVRAWHRCLESQAAHLRAWEAALDETMELLGRHRSAAISAGTSLLVTGIAGSLVYRTSRVMKAEAAHQAAEAVRHRGRAAEMVEGLRRDRAVGSLAEYDDLMARARHADELAAAAQEIADKPRLPMPAKGLLQSMNVAATGYGIYDDMENGESATQAVISQGGGLMAGGATAAGAGALTGAALGSTVPVAGTIIGGIVGGVVGGTVAIATDKFIDSRFEAARDDPSPGPARESAATTEGVLGLMLELEEAAHPSGKERRP